MPKLTFSLDPEDREGAMKAIVELHDGIPKEHHILLTLVLLDMFYHASVKMCEGTDVVMPPRLMTMTMTLLEAITRMKETPLHENDDDDEDED